MRLLGSVQTPSVRFIDAALAVRPKRLVEVILEGVAIGTGAVRRDEISHPTVKRRWIIREFCQRCQQKSATLAESRHSPEKEKGQVHSNQR